MTALLAKIAPIRKTAAAAIVGVLGWAAQVTASPPAAITAGEWVGLGTVLAVAFGVYAVANVPAP